MGNNGDSRDTSINPVLFRHSLFRGIYSRVARQLGVDRSYVSRVASGERRSAKVEAALLKEIKRIEKIKIGR
jgi:DNA-binding transcriptional regulator YdaS (Cro superfamily)